MRRGGWLLGMFVALAGCQIEATRCAQDVDCFVGERCEAGQCQPSAPQITPGCDPSDCAGPLTARTACVAEVCLVRECVEGAALCEQGCCEAQAPPATVGLLTLDALVPVLRVDTRGVAHLWSWDRKREVLVDLSWDGQRWRRDEVALTPESLPSFDVQYDARGLHIAYLSEDGHLMYARRDTQAQAFEVEAITTAQDNMALGLTGGVHQQPTLRFIGERPIVSWMYGTQEEIQGRTRRAGYPKAWSSERAPLVNQWSRQPMTEAGESALIWTSHAHGPLEDGIFVTVVRRDGEAGFGMRVWMREAGDKLWRVDDRLTRLLPADATSYIQDRDATTLDAQTTRRVTAHVVGEGKYRLIELALPRGGAPARRDLLERPQETADVFLPLRYVGRGASQQRLGGVFNPVTNTTQALLWPTLEEATPVMLETPTLRGVWWGAPRAGGIDIFYQSDATYDYIPLNLP